LLALDADRIDIAICPIDVLKEGSGLRFDVVPPGRNVVAYRTTHPLLMKRRLDPASLLDYPWVGPPEGSPLYADLNSLALSLGATEIKIRYSGGSLLPEIKRCTHRAAPQRGLRLPQREIDHGAAGQNSPPRARLGHIAAEQRAAGAGRGCLRRSCHQALQGSGTAD
jgi:DNA-binding transcriptional LysR family regulator